MNKPCEYIEYYTSENPPDNAVPVWAKGTLLAFGVDSQQSDTLVAITYSTAIIWPDDGGNLVNLPVEHVRILGDDS